MAADRTFILKNKKAGLFTDQAGSWVSLLLIVIGAVIFVFPFYICVVSAFKTQLETAEQVMSLPSAMHWENFVKAIKVTKFAQSFLNSAICTSTSVTLIVICSSMAGYVIARNSRMKGFRIWEIIFLAAMMLPFQVIMIPVYKILKTFIMLNTLYGVIILMVGTSIPYSVFLYIGFIKTVPKELEESGIIDGCGLFRRFWSIVFPLLKPITASVATLHIMWMWNEFNISLIVLQKESVKTIPIQQFYFFGQYTTNLNMAFASACLAILPIIVFFLLGQRFIVQGLTAGAVKG